MGCWAPPLLNDPATLRLLRCRALQIRRKRVVNKMVKVEAPAELANKIGDISPTGAAGPLPALMSLLLPARAPFPSLMGRPGALAPA